MEDAEAKCIPRVKEQVRFSHKRCMWSIYIPIEHAQVERALWPTRAPRCKQVRIRFDSSVEVNGI